jgi:hypothetical protein
MPNNLVCLQFSIDNSNSKILDLYIQLLHNNLINHPTIFTDKCDRFIHKDIPIFHTFYIRHLFRSKFILTNYKDYQTLKTGYHNVGKCIVLYENNDITNTTDIFLHNSGSNLLKDINNAIRSNE